MFTWLADYMAHGRSGKRSYQLAEQLYAAIVAQARQPDFYRDLDIKDTIKGRFEVISLHMFIVLDRLKAQGGLSDETAQELVNVMFQDMDDVARETGVGDMGVGPRIKKLARSFQSRLEYYKEAIEGDENGDFPRGELPDAITEIFFEDNDGSKGKAEKLAGYMTRSQAKMAELSLEEMSDEKPLFAPIIVA